MKNWLLSLALLCAPVAGQAEEGTESSRYLRDSRDMMISDLNYTKTLFESFYAPVDWKLNNLNWDLRVEIDNAKNQIWYGDYPTTKRYQQVLSDFYHSVRDYHVMVTFYSTESAYLPFEVRAAEGRYFIVDINRQWLPESIFPFFVGDEILTFGGRSVASVIYDLQQEMTSGYSNNAMTDYALAVNMLTMRLGARGMQIPSGPILIEGVNASGHPVAVQTVWFHMDEMIRDLGKKPSAKTPNALERLTHTQMFSPIAKMIADEKKLFSSAKKQNCSGRICVDNQADFYDENAYKLGARAGSLPRMGEVLWDGTYDYYFDAYLFQTPEGKKIGYLRIPDYYTYANEGGVRDLADLLTRFQNEADLLILDQMNNPGGYVFFGYAVLSMLTDRPLATPRHRMAIAQLDVLDAIEAIASLEDMDNLQSYDGSQMVAGYPLDLNFAYFYYNYSKFIIKQWEAGKYLTDLYYIGGVDYVNPSKMANFTKPILMLIDEMDFSAADFVPATLQDNRRAIIMGQRTAGAGGVVTTSSYPNSLGIRSVNYTTTLAERQNSVMVENVGVWPHVFYNVTANDLQNGRIDHIHAIYDTITRMLEGELVP